MRWLTEMYETAKRATGLLWYVLAFIVSAIVARIDWLEGTFRRVFAKWMDIKMPDGDPTMIIGIPSWIVGLIVLLFLLGVIFLNHARRLSNQLKSKIKITFEGAAPWMRRVPANTPSRDDPQKLVSTDSIYVRFKVENTSPDTVVRGCEAFLMKTSRKNSSGNFEEVSSGDSLRLPWAARPVDKIHSAIPIPHGLNVFCDLLSVDAEHNSVFVKWDVHLNANKDICSEPGVYRFDVLVISENGSPVTKQIFLNWPGQWNMIETWAE